MGNVDPRQVLKVLKANCQTAREQISKLPTKQHQRRKFSSSSTAMTISNTNSPKIKNRHKRSASTTNLQTNKIKKYKKRNSQTRKHAKTHSLEQFNKDWIIVE